MRNLTLSNFGFFFDFLSAIIVWTAWFRPTNNKNTANIFWSNLLLRILAKYDPTTENATPLMIIGIPTLKSTNLFLIWITKATKDIGINTSKLMAWALFCLNDKNIVKIGISSVPPPIPIPPTIPLTRPAKNNHKNSIIKAILSPQQ